MNAGNRFQYDCTHFCFTPYLWAPLANGLADAVEEAQARSKRLQPSSSSHSSTAVGGEMSERQRGAEDHRSTTGVSHRKFVGCETSADGECVEISQP